MRRLGIVCGKNEGDEVLKIRGIFLDREKNTEKSLTIALPTPERVCVPLPRGSRAEVKAGQWVLTGNRLCDGLIPAHASISGKVEEIKVIEETAGSYEAVVIKADEKQKEAAVSVPRADDASSFIAAVCASGCLAGERLARAKDSDTLIINGTECEQYVTSEYRCMLDDSKLIAAGIALTCRFMGIKKAHVAVAGDLPDAVKVMEDAVKDIEGCEVTKVRADYPGGADLVLVNNITGRRLKSGECAEDKKVLVLLPSEAAFIASYFETGMPFIKRRVTVDGDLVKTPCIAEVPIGTPLTDVLGFADANTAPAEKLIVGGMMTGRSVTDTDIPLGKQDNAVLIFMKPIDPGKGSLKIAETKTNCIKCGRCASACPVSLMPMRIEKAVNRKKLNKAEIKRLRPDLCIDCGACTYVCPAKRELNAVLKQAKELLGRKESEEE